MNISKFHGYTALTLLTAVVSALVFQLGLFYSGVLAASLALAGLFLSKLSLRQANSVGRTREMKVILVLFLPLYELVLLLGVNLSSIVPRYLALLCIGAVLMAEITEKGIVKEIRESVKPMIGRQWRVAILSTGLILSDVNGFYLVYSIALITVMAIYDSVNMVYRKLS